MHRLNSYDSAQRPISNVHYSQAPYQDQYYNASNAYLPPVAATRRKGTSKWIKFGIPALVIIIIAAVVAVVLVLRNRNSSGNNNSSAAAAASGSGSALAGAPPGGSGSLPTATSTDGTFPVAFNSWFLPVYPAEDNQALFIEPTFTASPTAAWPTETFAPATPLPTAVRPDRPRIIAPAWKWQALPTLIQTDPYMKKWHAQIMSNATQYKALPVVQYFMDGSSGILDNSRQVKERIKTYAYAYRMTQDSGWLDSAWSELVNAAGNGTQQFGTPPDRWNSGHFLDTAEMTSAFSIAYDWLYDAWTSDQRTAILWSIIELGLNFGLEGYTSGAWWTGKNTVISGNWNCVCNAGMTIGALAILQDDPTGVAAQILTHTIDNAKQNCVLGPSSDGTWTETPNYWYFGTTGMMELASSLISATGSEYGVMTTNPNLNLTGLFHIYVWGMTSLFNFADHGPNKYSSTANSMFFYADYFQTPRYMLHQRDMFDASSDPWSMFWYDPAVEGAWWDGLPLDHWFQDPETQWASMRTSWTDDTGMYIAMKSSKLVGHQTHGDLDCGDFVLDALGTRWFGELGSGDYNSPDYFTSEADNATRWLYYRKRTEGQNTIIINAANQLAVEAAPTGNFGSSGDTQGPSTVMTLSSDSTAFFTTDMSTAYGQGPSVVRGIRFLNQRQQVLLQDDITTDGTIMWRAHTNATVNPDPNDPTTATMLLDGQTLIAKILSPTTGASWVKMEAVRLPSDPPPPVPDQPNPGVTVMTISLPAGTYSLQVLFNPQWSGVAQSEYVTPPNVPLTQWTLDSHNSQ